MVCVSERKLERPGRPAETADYTSNLQEPPGFSDGAVVRPLPPTAAGGPHQRWYRGFVPLWQKIRRQIARLQPPARAGWPEGELRPLLAAFAWRVGRRYALETIRLALTWGLAVAAVVLIFLHWTPLPAVTPAAAAGALAAALVSAGRWLLRPDALAVVRVADSLGLDGAAVTAYRLLRDGDKGINGERGLTLSTPSQAVSFNDGENGTNGDRNSMFPVSRRATSLDIRLLCKPGGTGRRMRIAPGTQLSAGLLRWKNRHAKYYYARNLHRQGVCAGRPSCFLPLASYLHFQGRETGGADRPIESGVKTAAFALARERVDLPAAWQQAALSRSLAACAGFMAGLAGRFPMIPSWTPWRGIAILLVVFTGLALTPSPLLPYWEARREERAALAAAAATAERLVEPLAELKHDGQPLLPEELQQRLADLELDIGSAGRREEAATKLRQAERDLEQAAAELDPAGRDAAQLAALWQEQAGAAWQQLAAALAGGDTAAAEQAARELWSELAGLPRGSQQAQEAALRFW